MFKSPIGTTCHTGQTCPESGIWEAIGFGTTAPIAKGNTFPPCKGQSAVWKLVQYA